MPINEQVDRYSVRVFQDNFQNHDRQIRLLLTSGHEVFIQFPEERPADFVTITGASTTLKMTRDQYDDVYHLLQTESPVFFTALKVLGLTAAAVHSEVIELAQGEPPGEGTRDAQTLEALVARAIKAGEPVARD